MAPNIHWFYLALALARTMARDGQRVAEGLPAGDEAEDKLFIYSLGLLLLKHAVPKNTKKNPRYGEDRSNYMHIHGIIIDCSIDD